MRSWKFSAIFRSIIINYLCSSIFKVSVSWNKCIQEVGLSGLNFTYLLMFEQKSHFLFVLCCRCIIQILTKCLEHPVLIIINVWTKIFGAVFIGCLCCRCIIQILTKCLEQSVWTLSTKLGQLYTISQISSSLSFPSCWPTPTPQIHSMVMRLPCIFTGM